MDDIGRERALICSLSGFYDMAMDPYCKDSSQGESRFRDLRKPQTERLTLKFHPVHIGDSSIAQESELKALVPHEAEGMYKAPS